MVDHFPQCFSCKHFDLEKTNQEVKLICDAFPDGIPAQIANNKHDHTQPYRGDGGIRYEPIETDK